MTLKYQTLRKNSLLLLIIIFKWNIWTKDKRKGLVDKSDIFNFVKNTGLRTKLATLATKAELKAELDLSYFVDNNFFGDDGFHNIFVYQPTLIH